MAGPARLLNALIFSSLATERHASRMGGALSSPKKGPSSIDRTAGIASSARHLGAGAQCTAAGTSSAVGASGNNDGAEGLLLPSSRDEYFLSIVLVPGCEEAESQSAPSIADDDDDDSASRPTPPKSPYWNSMDRRQGHLRWAIHRGVMHGCQPAMFWRTPFVGDGEDKGSPDAEKPAVEVTRYLSQFAQNFVFGSSTESSATSKRRVIVYLVSPNDEGDDEVLSTQVNRIIKLWDDAGRARRDVKASCVLMKASDFDHSVLCTPPYTDIGEEGEKDEEDKKKSATEPSPSGKVETKNNDDSSSPSKDHDKGGEANHLSPDVLAAVRGAGLLHGYPALVIDCKPKVIQCVCTDVRGTIIGNTFGSGLGVKLNEILSTKAKDSEEECSPEQEMNAHHRRFIRPVDASNEQIKKAVDNTLGDKKEEVVENARRVVSFWIYRLNQSASKGAPTTRLSEEGAAALCRLERVASALDKFYGEYSDSEESGNGNSGNLTRQTPIFRSLYDLNNGKKDIVLSGIDSELIGDLINTHRKNPAITPAVQFNALEQDISGEDGFLHFPWDNSPAAACWDGEKDDEADVNYSARRAVHAIQKNDTCIHLPHFGVAASVMAHYINRRYLINIIGTRVAKIFTTGAGGKTLKRNIYRGRISKVEQEGIDQEEYFFIMYDDGDSEHVSKNELLKMISLYAIVGEHGSIDDMEAAERKRSGMNGDGDNDQPDAKRQRKKTQMPGFITHFD